MYAIIARSIHSSARSSDGAIPVSTAIDATVHVTDCRSKRVGSYQDLGILDSVQPAVKRLHDRTGSLDRKPREIMLMLALLLLESLADPEPELALEIDLDLRRHGILGFVPVDPNLAGKRYSHEGSSGSVIRQYHE
jgi:hypothetical protein